MDDLYGRAGVCSAGRTWEGACRGFALVEGMDYGLDAIHWVASGLWFVLAIEMELREVFSWGFLIRHPFPLPPPVLFRVI